MNEIQKGIYERTKHSMDEVKFILHSLRNAILKYESNAFEFKVIDFIDFILSSSITKNIDSVEWKSYLYSALSENELIKKTIDGQLSAPECRYLGSYLNSIYLACIYFDYLNIELVDKIRSQQVLKRENELLYEDSLKIIELEKELDHYKNSEKNKKAQEIYDGVNVKYAKKETIYRRWFISILIFSVLVTLGYDPNFTLLANLASLYNSITSTEIINAQSIVSNSIENKQISVSSLQNYSLLKFIFFKIAILVVGITLSTYFLKLSNYYRSLKDQAQQTKLELEAFPDYVAGLDHEVTNRLRETLALKYFGQELDKSINEKMGSLIQDQISSGTELIKASAELVKAKGESKPTL